MTGDASASTTLTAIPTARTEPGFRDFVAFEGTPTATIPGPTASVQVSMGSTPLCAMQDGGTKFDVFTVSVLIGGPGPITVSNIRYTAGSTGRIEGSASNGPVQLQFQGGGAVGPPFSLVTADTSNAWVTDISLTGGNVSQAIILPSPPVTLNPITIAEHLTDAFGPAGIGERRLCRPLRSRDLVDGPDVECDGDGSVRRRQRHRDRHRPGRRRRHGSR